jgi:hypothetical protein
MPGKLELYFLGFAVLCERLGELDAEAIMTAEQ